MDGQLSTPQVSYSITLEVSSSQIQQQYPQTPIAPPPVQSTNNLLYETIQRLDRLDGKLLQVEARLKPLEEIDVKLNSLTAEITFIENRVCLLKTTIDALEKSLEFASKSLDEIKLKVSKVDSFEKELKLLSTNNQNLQTQITDLQMRSMRDSLLFFNLTGCEEENCEEIVKKRCRDKLKLENAEHIKFDRVHLLGKRGPNTTRPIVAKFCMLKDLERVRNAPKNLQGSGIGIGKQFPREVQEQRRKLVPSFKRLREAGRNAKLSGDKLYVDGHLYNGPECHA
ncbi:uncharacterized protein LOC121373503 [Gigantopelta aegis]|uniref:uncharacterized protein LOC121373503 n=1 Tax=Gigantopelta aegis TaxID=1735272 RepID=UPI001B888A44|nr:uncharacterized protein LOC121373503 [Gigantopelta aegis]